MAFDISQDSYESLRSIVAERTDRLVAWVGSGLSIPAGLPSWRTLRSRLQGALLNKAETLEAEDSAKLKKTVETIRRMPDIWTAFDLLCSHLGETTWRATIRGVLNPPSTSAIPEGYISIWRMNVHGMLSLNLDRLAARSYIEVFGQDSPTEFNGNESGNFTHVLRSPRRFICNLHGHIDNSSSWVLTSSALKRLLTNPAYRTFVNSCLTSNTNIFFGMGVDDIAVRSLLAGLTQLGIDFGEHYWVTNRKDIETDRFAERIGVRLIRYDAPRNDHAAISEVFADLLAHVSPEDEDVKQPAFLRPCEFEEGDELPNPKDILQLDTEDVRRLLNNRAMQILSSHSPDTYREYEDFSNKYDEAIYRAWYTSVDPGSNMLFNYVLNREHAYGAFGKVFQANTPDGHEVAIKVLHQEIRRDPDLLHSFRRGVRSMTILSNHGVEGMVAYRDASEIPAFVVMDWVDGVSLKEAVEAKQVADWVTILRIGSSASTIVRSGHLLPERVLHRDLRPSNIMLKGFWTNPEDWQVVVLDFDLSWYRGSFEKSIVHGSALLGYLAPEQMQPIPGVSTRHTAVDSFGLGMTLFFMCSGRDPMPNEHLHRSWEDTVLESVNRVQKCTWNSIPNRVSRLIKKATQQNQRDRWDMAQIEGELQRLIGAVENPGSVEAAELVAEEIAARCQFMDQYQWDEDRATATKDAPSGTKLLIAGDESNRLVHMELSWGLPGIHGRGENVGKWIPQRMENAAGILRKGGWEVEAEHKWAVARIAGSVTVRKAVSSLEQVADGLRQAADLLRFD